jgi:hypothetical protein
LVPRDNGCAVAVRNGRGVPIHPAARVGLFEAPSGEYFYHATRIGPREMAMPRE